MKRSLNGSTKRSTVLAGLAAGALVLAACSSDAGSGGSTADSASKTETAASDTAMSDTAGDTAMSDTAMSETAMSETAMSETAASETAMSETAMSGDHSDWPDKLVFTLTPSQEAGGLIDTAQPLADALSDSLGVPVEALVPSDYAGVIVALQSGQAQIAGGLGPAQMVAAEDEADAVLALQAVRYGSSQYVTQWFTNTPDEFCADTPVANEDGMLFCNGVDKATDPSEGPIGLDQLPKVSGKTVAFVDQGSTSGFQVPALELLNAGVDPFDDITQLMAGGHDTAVQAVYDGDAEVGVSFNDARGQLVETVPDVGEKVVVFGWSEPIPNDGFAVAGDLPEDLQKAIIDSLVSYSETEAGKTTLDELYEIDGLVPVPAGSYDVIRQLQAELGDKLD